jgi:hypothetical protein
MNPQRLGKPLALLSAAAALLLAPTSGTPAKTLGTAQTCAAGTCCREAKSYCSPAGTGSLADHYYLSEGACPSS